VVSLFQVNRFSCSWFFNLMSSLAFNLKEFSFLTVYSLFLLIFIWKIMSFLCFFFVRKNTIYLKRLCKKMNVKKRVFFYFHQNKKEIKCHTQSLITLVLFFFNLRISIIFISFNCKLANLHDLNECVFFFF